jgi:hypothetical protein
MKNTDSIGEKPQIYKLDVAKRLYFLNLYISELVEKRDKCPDESLRNDLSAEIKELYSLKANVLLKMLADGNAYIRCMQKNHKRSYYVVRIKFDYTFHLPVTEDVKRVLDGKNKKKMP